MRCPHDRERRQIGHPLLGSGSADPIGGVQSADHREHLEVDDLRRCQPAAAQPGPHLRSVLAVVDQCRGERARVNDDHGRRGRSRS